MHSNVNIGEPLHEIEVEPLEAPSEIPVTPEPAPVPVPEPEKVPV